MMATMSVDLRPMTDAELAAYVEQASAGYVAERVAAGELREHAETVAERQLAEYLPGGKPADGHHLFCVVAGQRTVGVLWLGPTPIGRPGMAWIYDIEIDEEHRGKGYGRATLNLAEREAARHGWSTLGLNVFGNNHVARALYESHGFNTANITMSKPISQP